ncbi:hypothetical protein G647_09744, partial [Cladophialophora carrionii CBS 160.54]
RKRARGLPSRVTAVSILRPNIVLLNEIHPYEEEIRYIIEKDRAIYPDLLLIIGTKITIPGI